MDRAKRTYSYGAHGFVESWTYFTDYVDNEDPQETHVPQENQDALEQLW